ncbi:hypothetical protein GCM10008107_25570 [Psychrosphaera saromensis]|nr:hypothetical protein GCM10008107_25570 [Psychrosphaera saromensis]GLQ12670.1 hypothetical protein GCM10007917_01250 [Psychrosphaera saromensis]
MDMALPLIAIASVIGAGVAHESRKTKYKNLEQLRLSKATNSKNLTVVKSPSDNYSSDSYAEPLPGSLVCCEVFNLFDHSGIWIDQDTIIELSSNGLVKAVSANRFLADRSGENIFVACNAKHQPIIVEGCEDRAVNSVFTYREYDVLENNCHRFAYYCLSNKDVKVSRFARLNELLITMVEQNIYWDKVKV